ncbi:hypothetical protein [Rudaea sp.]|uniref:hypothetical protein n=1 Tax=Rudaea sp. TaxID=2136325 RepID=UPI002ED54989
MAWRLPDAFFPNTVFAVSDYSAIACWQPQAAMLRRGNAERLPVAWPNRRKCMDIRVPGSRRIRWVLTQALRPAISKQCAARGGAQIAHSRL